MKKGIVIWGKGGVVDVVGGGVIYVWVWNCSLTSMGKFRMSNLGGEGFAHIWNGFWVDMESFETLNTKKSNLRMKR